MVRIDVILMIQGELELCPGTPGARARLPLVYRSRIALDEHLHPYHGIGSPLHRFRPVPRLIVLDRESGISTFRSPNDLP